MKAAPIPLFKTKLRNSAIVAQARVDAERWVDDGGSFRTEAVPSAPTSDELKNVAAARPGEHVPGKN